MRWWLVILHSLTLFEVTISYYTLGEMITLMASLIRCPIQVLGDWGSAPGRVITVTYKLNILVAILQDIWCWGLRARTGRLCVSILRLGDSKFDQKLWSKCGSTYNCGVLISMHALSVISKTGRRFLRAQRWMDYIVSWLHNSPASCKQYLRDRSL